MREGRILPTARPSSLKEAPFWKRQHLLDVDELSREEMEVVLEITAAMKEVLGRELPRVPALRGTSIVTLFYEPSTRTRASFELAAKALGADIINVAAETSSVKKGESLLDTVRTLQAVGANILVMRHWQSGAPYLVAREANLSVINAGDGCHAHPTQALLDLYTLRSRLGDPSAGSGQALRGKRVVIVGDIVHSRVARSNLWGLTAMGAEVVVCGPPTLLPWGLYPSSASGGSGPAPGSDANNVGATFRSPEPAMSSGHGLALPPVEVETNLDRALEGADVIMALRLQLERMSASGGGLLPSIREYVRLYQVNEERLARARPGALVLHPGPMNEGVEISPGVARGAQSVIEEQVSNGVAVRMAVLYLLGRGK